MTLCIAMAMMVLVVVAPVGLALAQPDNAPITCGYYRTIHSEVLGENRTLLVCLPEDYGTSDKKYPVLYKLDGEKGSFLQTSSAARYLFDMGENTPDPIIVGIGNTERNRDMGPEQGADRFIQFLKAELIPYIDKNYKTSGFRILCGQSLSSLFAMYSFVKQPALFDAYILSSFGLYKESLAGLFERELRSNRDLTAVGKKYIFVTNGKKDAYDPDGSIAGRGAKFLDSLAHFVTASVLIKTRYYDDEGHVPFPAFYDGLRWVYSCEKTGSR